MKVKFKKSQIKEVSKKILKKAEKRSNSGATIIAFYGNLGAGKTTLTKELAQELGIKQNLISPTFVIMKSYDIKKKNKFKKLIHIDAYRLDSHHELLKIGWEDIINDKNNLIIIEWPEKVIECIPNNHLKFELSHIDEETRVIDF